MGKVKKGSAIAALCSILAVGGGLTVMNQRAQEPTSTISVYEAQANQKEYTVMVYMIGSDLEADGDEQAGAGSADLREMVDVMGGGHAQRINERMNLIVETGGSERWDIDALADIKNARFCIDADGICRLETLPEIDMGEPETLADFINYAAGNYPAENYVLVLWNHGNGPVEGYGYDMLYDGDSLTLMELDEGIAASEVTRFALVGFDACLMGNMETVNVISRYADYMVASADLEAQDGWDYSWLEIFAQETFDTVGIGTRIVDCYADFYSKKKGQATLSCYDLGAYPDVRQEMEMYNMLVFENADADLYETASRIRTGVQGFGDKRAALDSPDLVDFVGFYQGLSPEAWAAAALEPTLDALVLSSKSVGYAQEPCGISIYVPSGSDWMLEESNAKYQKSLFLESYLEFVQGYSSYILTGDTSELDTAAVDYQEKDQTFAMTMDAEEMNRVAAAYLITAAPIAELPGCSLLLSTDSALEIGADGRLEAEPDETCAGLMGEPLCLIEQYNSEAYTEYLSPLLYNDELCLARIRFSDENPDGDVLGIVPMDNGTTSSKREYLLEPGVSVTPLYPLITEADMDVVLLTEERGFYKGEYYIGNSLQIEEEYDALLETVEIPLQDCLFGFMIQDTRQQLWFTELLPQTAQ